MLRNMNIWCNLDRIASQGWILFQLDSVLRPPPSDRSGQARKFVGFEMHNAPIDSSQRISPASNIVAWNMPPTSYNNHPSNLFAKTRGAVLVMIC